VRNPLEFGTVSQGVNVLGYADERTYGYESVGTTNCTPSTGFRRLYTILIKISSYSGAELWVPCVEGPGVCGSGVEAVGADQKRWVVRKKWTYCLRNPGRDSP
jgi:hypothetical protein